jgi:non-heme chloroperoxidase
MTVRQHTHSAGMMGGIKAQYDCIKALSESEFYDDLQMIDTAAL